MYPWLRVGLAGICTALVGAVANGASGAHAARSSARTSSSSPSAPFPSAHASTIVETPAGLVAAWFGGTREKHPDVGIWLSRHDGRTWSAPVEVATGRQADGRRYPCWNPVLFRPTEARCGCSTRWARARQPGGPS